ncbi:MAG: DUF5684 domain-containing protein [Opitutales bacterium]|nr:DUF5684 domain-containing protein [Opitutales bacterium]
MNLTAVFATVLAADVPSEVYGKIFVVCFLAVSLVAALAFSIRGLWLIFEKAGHEGWKAIIPVYHHVILTRIAGLSAWWTLPLLLVLPFLKAHDKGPKLLCLALLAIWWIWLCQRIAKRFGKGVGFGLGLALPGTDFYFRTALAFDKSTYNPQP